MRRAGTCGDGRRGCGRQRTRAFATHFFERTEGGTRFSNFALATTRRAKAACRHERTLGSRTSYPGNSGMSVTRLMAARGVRHGAVASEEPSHSLLISWHESLCPCQRPRSLESGIFCLPSSAGSRDVRRASMDLRRSSQRRRAANAHVPLSRRPVDQSTETRRAHQSQTRPRSISPPRHALRLRLQQVGQAGTLG